MDSFDQATNRFGIDFCKPAYRPELARSRPYAFGPNLTIAKGQCIAVNTANTNDVATLTVTGTPTGGTITVQLTNPLDGETAPLVVPFNSSAAAAQTLVNALQGFSGNLTVGGGALPGTPLTFTGAGAWAAMPIAVPTVLANGLTGGSSPAGTFAHTTTGAGANTAVAYANGGSNGSGTAIGASMYDVATDATGGITLGSAATGNRDGSTYREAPVWTHGEFFTADLVGWDATAQGQVGRVEGGVLHIN